MARAALGLGVRDLAEYAQVSPDTIARLERGEKLKNETIIIISNSLQNLGIKFIDDEKEYYGVLIKSVIDKK